MTGNKIGIEGAKGMSEMLKENTTLTSLDLGCEGEIMKMIKFRGKRGKNDDFHQGVR